MPLSIEPAAQAASTEAGAATGRARNGTVGFDRILAGLREAPAAARPTAEHAPRSNAAPAVAVRNAPAAAGPAAARSPVAGAVTDPAIDQAGTAPRQPARAVPKGTTSTRQASKPVAAAPAAAVLPVAAEPPSAAAAPSTAPVAVVAAIVTPAPAAESHAAAAGGPGRNATAASTPAAATCDPGPSLSAAPAVAPDAAPETGDGTAPTRPAGQKAHADPAASRDRTPRAAMRRESDLVASPLPDAVAATAEAAAPAEGDPSGAAAAAPLATPGAAGGPDAMGAPAPRHEATRPAVPHDIASATGEAARTAPAATSAPASTVEAAAPAAVPIASVAPATLSAPVAAAPHGAEIRNASDDRTATAATVATAATAGATGGVEDAVPPFRPVPTASGLSVRMSLDGLGEVEIRVDRADGGAPAVTIAADRQETREAVSHDASHIHALLDLAGVDPAGRTLSIEPLPPAAAPQPARGTGADQPGFAGDFSQRREPAPRQPYGAGGDAGGSAPGGDGGAPARGTAAVGRSRSLLLADAIDITA